MVTRIQGAPQQGVWFSADVRFVQLTVNTSTYLTDLVADETRAQLLAGVNSDLEIVLELLSTRCTVIGLSVETALVAQFMVDYGQGVDPLAGSDLGGQDQVSFETWFEAAVIANTTATTAEVVVEEGFVADALGTPG